MSWQDVVLSVGSLIFAIALIPSVRSDDKPALSSSVVTATVLVVFAVVYATLGLWFSTLCVSITAVLWSILAVQKYKQARAPQSVGL